MIRNALDDVLVDVGGSLEGVVSLAALDSSELAGVAVIDLDLVGEYVSASVLGNCELLDLDV